MGLVVYYDESARIKSPPMAFWQNQADKLRNVTAVTAL